MGQSQQVDEAIRNDMAQKVSREEQLQSELTENGTLLNVAVEAKRLITEAIDEDNLGKEELEAANTDIEQLNQIIKGARHAHVGLLFGFMQLVSQARERRTSQVEQISKPVEVDLNIKGRS